MDEIASLRSELNRLLHRRGDLATMRDDLAAQLDAIDRESTATVGAIQATRIRIGNLEAGAPKMVPLDMTPTMDIQPMHEGKPVKFEKK